MTKKEARDLLTAHACCTYCSNENKLHNECPWHNKKQCEDVKMTGKLVQDAINTIQGATVMKMRLSDIKILIIFAENDPKIHKVVECRNHWIEYHVQDRYLVVNKNGYLIDGYIQYLVLKEQGVEEAEVKQLNRVGIGKKKKKNKVKARYTPKYRNEPTIYVYGYHPESESKHELMWRIPKSEKWTWFKENLRVGDKITCCTKYGDKPVIVTKIETLDKCPVDMVVKRVKNTEIMRGGYNVVP